MSLKIESSFEISFFLAHNLATELDAGFRRQSMTISVDHFWEAPQARSTIPQFIRQAVDSLAS